jgi:c(7)-type cytochrome triheme protein
MRKRLMLFAAVLVFSAPAILFGIGGGDITFTPEKADPVLFSHDYHLKLRGLKCAACHFNKFANGVGYEMKKESITKRGFCEHCHNGMKAFDVDSSKNCTRCHKKEG